MMCAEKGRKLIAGTKIERSAESSARALASSCGVDAVGQRGLRGHGNSLCEMFWPLLYADDQKKNATQRLEVGLSAIVQLRESSESRGFSGLH